MKDIIFTVQFTCNYTYTLEARKFTLKSVQHFFSPPLLLEHMCQKKKENLFFSLVEANIQKRKRKKKKSIEQKILTAFGMNVLISCPEKAGNTCY